MTDRIDKILAQFSGETFSSHEQVKDWLRITLTFFEQEIREDERKKESLKTER